MKHNTFSVRKQKENRIEPIDKLNHIINRMQIVINKE